MRPGNGVFCRRKVGARGKRGFSSLNWGIRGAARVASRASQTRVEKMEQCLSLWARETRGVLQRLRRISKIGFSNSFISFWSDLYLNNRIAVARGFTLIFLISMRLCSDIGNSYGDRSSMVVCCQSGFSAKPRGMEYDGPFRGLAPLEKLV